MAKQEQLPSMKQKKDSKLVGYANAYVEHRDKRIKVQQHEISAKNILLDYLKEKKLERYEDAEDDLLVIVSPGKEKLKVKVLSEADGDDEGDGEAEDRENEKS